LIKTTIHQEEVTIVSIYASNINILNFIKETLLDDKTIMLGDFNIPFSQKVNKETSELSNIIVQMDLTNIYRIFHPTTTEYTFFPAIHKNFSKVGHILGHKASLNKYKTIEITPCILADHSGINYKSAAKETTESNQAHRIIQC
jgi:endonuclease/exonuclease/phosphatase family metal-dependent hydrolase